MIERAQRGDDAAWDVLVRQHQTAVFRLAYLLLGNAADAEDCAQETFERAWRAFGRFDPARPLQPWLLQIAANGARNKRRSAGRYMHALRRLVTFAPVSEQTSTLFAEHDAADTLWQAIRRLGGSDQELLYMRYFLELGEADIAAALQIAPGTVKSRQHRALARLRKVVAMEFPDLREERNA
jgi:RNA polymerase sigma-70 factor (ECF subfamily)